MLASVLRTAARPAARATRASLKPAVRALSATAARKSGHAPPPSLFGPGAKAGEVPTDFEQATGLDRLQVLGEMEGVEVFDEEPLDASRLGTLADPILVPSLDVERIVGCTGFPADSHDVHWFQLTEHKNRRCPECGSAYKLDFQGTREEHAHAH
ncbi:hypothetical protein PLICRDRAFT_53107 [Plicaturopsis crispa FD-325 SS-3]|nr:hypothetical protein PLICRDRAFT_53107 [Plicaturopsis crispa FD-325 SS-3]